jgi:hypothetical protein
MHRFPKFGNGLFSYFQKVTYQQKPAVSNTFLSDAWAKCLLVLELLFRRFDSRRLLFALRKKHCLQIQQRCISSAKIKSLSVPEISAADISSSKFHQITNGLTSPVVIKGFLRDSDACAKWGLSYFQEKLGESVYPAIKDSRKEDSETKENEVQLIKVRDLLEGISRGEHTYLNNVTKIFADNPFLIEELQLGKLASLVDTKVTNGDRFDLINMFLGGKGTGNSLHCAFAGNFFCNIVGRKKWLLIAPEYSTFLCPIPANPFIYADCYYNPEDEILGQKTSNLPRWSVILEPGDVLFNAPWWWHSVENLDDLTVGCAVRQLNFQADFHNNFLFTIFSDQPLLHLWKSLFNIKRKLTKEQRIFRDIMLSELDRKIIEGRLGIKESSKKHL